jgi:hypothetical protein
MATLSNFYPYVLPEVPGCPEISVDVALRSSLIEFCEKSLVIQRDHDPLTVVAGVVDYDFEPPTGSLVVKVMKAWYKSEELIPLAPDEVEDAELYNRSFSGANTTGSQPRYILQKDERTFSLYPIPDVNVANGLTMRVAYKPTRTASSFEDVLFEDYAEVIAAGAKARLMMSPGKTYTNPQLAVALMDMFGRGVNTARSRAGRGHVRSDLSVQMRRL